MDFHTSALFQALSLMELLIVGTEEHWNIPDSSLQQVMDTYAETTAHVSHTTIVIDTRQKTEAVDNQDACILK